MAIEAKEFAIHIGKGLLFAMKTSYRAARDHPSISCILFVLVIIYRAFPSLFAFLVSSSPVIFCTALLLGTLLSYGTRDIPGEEENETKEISSLQVQSAVDDLVTKKDDTFTVEEREVCDRGLTVNITTPASDNLVDSSLGSPWQPINTHDASSGSDSDSSGSSSPDASMADISPMLDELRPHPQDVVTWTADDQKSVMDIGDSEAERNLRLESLSAEWRGRKAESFETGKNLDFLDSYCDTPMASVSTPQHNPFDASYNSNVDDVRAVDTDTSVVVEETSQPIDSFGSLEEEIGEAQAHAAGIEVIDTEHIEQSSSDIGDDRAVVLNTSIVVEEARQPNESCSAVEEIGEAPGSLHLSDAAELEVIEECNEESNSSSSEENDKISGIPIQEELRNLDEDLLYEGKEDLISTSLSSDVKADFLDVESAREPLEIDPSVDVSKASEDVQESAAVDSSRLSPVDSESDEITQSEAGLEESHVSILDVPSIPEDNVDYFKVEEVHKNTIEPTVGSVEDARDIASVTEAESVYNPKLHVLEARSLEELDSFFKLHHKSSVEAPSSIILDSSEVGPSELHVVKETDPQFQVIEAKNIEEVHKNTIEHTVGTMEDVSDNVSVTEAETVYNPNLHVLEARSLEELDSLFKLHHKNSVEPSSSIILDSSEVGASELDIVEDSDAQFQVIEAKNTEQVHKNTIEHTIGTTDDVSDIASVTEDEPSVFPSRDDPEMTVYNPKMHVLEARSLEELDTFFKLHHESSVEPSSSIILDSSDVGPSDLDVQDIELATKKLSDGGLEFLEAKSLEDINLAFKQFSEGADKNPNPLELMENEDEFVEGESSQRQLESEVFNVHSTSPSESRYEPEHREVRYSADRDSKESVDEEKSDEKSDGNTIVDAVSDSTTASVSRKSRKKVKSGSGSSSSSSSSSSDSD